jgi:DNA-binding transcriptional regulator YiaG
MPQAAERRGKGRPKKFERTGNEQADYVIAIRMMYGWTQAELAEKLGIARQTVTIWEKGERAPSGLAKRLLALLAAKKPLIM